MIGKLQIGPRKWLKMIGKFFEFVKNVLSSFKLLCRCVSNWRDVEPWHGKSKAGQVPDSKLNEKRNGNQIEKLQITTVFSLNTYMEIVPATSTDE